MKFQIPGGLENMIPWEEVTNNDLLRTLLEREDFFLMGRWEEGREEMNYRSYKGQKPAVLSLTEDEF